MCAAKTYRKSLPRHIVVPRSAEFFAFRYRDFSRPSSTNQDMCSDLDDWFNYVARVPSGGDRFHVAVTGNADEHDSVRLITEQFAA
jgi:hypothetical protein